MWPRYNIGGNPDSLHALGVVSVNFANFERSVTWVFAAVARKSEDDARLLQLKDGTTASISKIEEASQRRAWSGTVEDCVHHFVAAARTLIENRNLLMHSVVIAGPNNTCTFYRTGKRGEREMVQATTEQIRSVADALYDYFNFALALANCIAVKVDGADRQAGTIVFADWPDAPPMPGRLRPFASKG
jgi:hypothetical protein